jgi:hypothetical protein
VPLLLLVLVAASPTAPVEYERRRTWAKDALGFCVDVDDFENAFNRPLPLMFRTWSNVPESFMSPDSNDVMYPSSALLPLSFKLEPTLL